MRQVHALRCVMRKIKEREKGEGDEGIKRKKKMGREKELKMDGKREELQR